MKKSINLLVFALAMINIAMFLVPNVYALETNDYVLKNQGTIEDVIENQRNLDRAKEAMEQYLEDESSSIIPLSTLSSVSYGLSSYPIFRQEENYYCGPAVVKEAIQHITGSSSSQDTYAASMGTSSNGGTYVYRLTNELNNRQNELNFVYEQQSSSSNTTRVNNMYNIIRFSTGMDSPVILHSRTGSIYMYNGRNVGHYLTAISVNVINGTPETVGYVDSFYNDYGRGSVYGYHTDTIENMAQSVSGRYLIYGNGTIA